MGEPDTRDQRDRANRLADRVLTYSLWVALAALGVGVVLFPLLRSF
jgi:hypothetical protein